MPPCPRDCGQAFLPASRVCPSPGLSRRRDSRRRLKSPGKSMATMPLTGANDFPVVCVGGSAGGLDAYIRLLQHLPCDLDVAVVIVNHLRKTATLLHEILPKYTKMPVELITEGLVIRPNHVFIIPP